uniref:Tail protein n=1 Tax=Desulfobacca acetoxidans TaxID=60893 RepID=A0A7V4G8Q0_9BACT
MAKDPVTSLDHIIKGLVPKVKKVVEDNSKRLWDRTVSRHLTGGTGPDRLARRSGTLARSTRPLKVRVEGSKVTGGLAFGAEYAGVHIGPGGSQVTIRPKNKKFLAIPLPAAKTAAGVPRGGPLDGIWGPTFIAKGVIFGFKKGTKREHKNPIPLFVLKRSVVVPRRVDPKGHLLDWVKPAFVQDLSQLVKGV